MSQDDNFISRWARLKRDWRSRSERDAERWGSAAPSRAGPCAANKDAAAGTETGATPAVDLASLPAIDSITADTDISVFLQSGVPVKLAEAALRRAWMSDPAIRDFIGIAENQWDFTDPTTIPGFGPLRGMDDKLNLATQATGILDGELSAQLPDAGAATEQKALATGASDRNGIAATARETQVVSAMCAADSETSYAPPEKGSVEAAAKNDLAPGKRACIAVTRVAPVP
jgi:hypothetical protein